MNSFLIRRLTPFFIFSLVSEGLVFAILLAGEYNAVDWSFFSMVKTVGVLLLTTCVSFMYLMIPYVLYLLFLPRKLINGRFDRSATAAMFSFYVFITLLEETASVIFWKEFSAAFNFIAVDYLVYTHEVLSNIYQSYPVIWYLAGIVTAAIIIVLLSRKYLFTNLQAPLFGRRLFYTLIYAVCCVLTFKNVDISNLEVNQNRFNNELSKEGVYSLFSAFWKNELPYQDFYLTRDNTDNLKILQRELASPEAEFTSPKQNINRSIDYNKRPQKHNVIIVLMESMSAEFLQENRKPEERILTPNLSQLSKEGIFFPNTYATGTRSVRGIEALTLSVPPSPGMSIVRRPGNENLYSIGSIFKDKGYDNKWIYGGFGYFDNMNYFFEKNHFKVLDRGKWDEGEVTFANAWGASDENTFAKVIKEADKSYANEKPFFTMLLTISNHRPYSFPSRRIDLPSITARREGGVKYADYAIGKFIEEAKNRPWFDNTIFLFVADHTAGAAGRGELMQEDYHIPMLFYAPKLLNPRRIEIPVSQIDALPTLLGLMNFEYESRFYGKDALRKDYVSRFFISNYQKLGYVKNGVEIILKPVKQFSAQPGHSPFKERYLEEAIAYYQEASDWQNNLKHREKEHESD